MGWLIFLSWSFLLSCCKKGKEETSEQIAHWVIKIPTKQSLQEWHLNIKAARKFLNRGNCKWEHTHAGISSCGSFCKCYQGGGELLIHNPFVTQDPVECVKNGAWLGCTAEVLQQAQFCLLFIYLCFFPPKIILIRSWVWELPSDRAGAAVIIRSGGQWGHVSQLARMVT